MKQSTLAGGPFRAHQLSKGGRRFATLYEIYSTLVFLKSKIRNYQEKI